MLINFVVAALLIPVLLILCSGTFKEAYHLSATTTRGIALAGSTVLLGGFLLTFKVVIWHCPDFFRTTPSPKSKKEKDQDADDTYWENYTSDTSVQEEKTQEDKVENDLPVRESPGTDSTSVQDAFDTFGGNSDYDSGGDSDTGVGGSDD